MYRYDTNRVVKNEKIYMRKMERGREKVENIISIYDE